MDDNDIVVESVSGVASKRPIPSGNLEVPEFRGASA